MSRKGSLGGLDTVNLFFAPLHDRDCPGFWLESLHTVPSGFYRSLVELGIVLRRFSGFEPIVRVWQIGK